jgi:L-fuculose-phosphate aldolase
MSKREETASPAEQLSAVMTRIYSQRLSTSSGGNLSVLDADGGLWVTPSRADKGRLGVASMVKIAPDGSWSGGLPPTSEWPFHRAVLDARADIRAVVHAHSTSLVAFSIVGRPLPLTQFPDLCRWTNRVAVSPYAMPGSRELGENLRATFASGCDAALMENHGAVTCGRDLLEAFFRLEALECLATILVAGIRLGPLRPLGEARMQEARDRMACAWESFAFDSGTQSAAREDLADYLRRAHGRGLLGGRTGAFSCRCGQGFLIGPDGGDNATMQAGDLVYVEGNRCEHGRTPDAMTPLHQAVYAADAQVRSVATALPPNLMAFAASGSPLDTRIIPEAYLFLKCVPVLPFQARFDGAQVAEALDAGRPVALIESACAVVTGASPLAVFERLDVAELTARSVLDARAIGPLRPMSDEVLQEICRSFGG